MLSVEKAKQAVIENIHLLSVENISIDNAYGYVLAEDIYSPLALPPFNQSAMDGYAFIFEDFKNNLQINIIAEVAAGDSFKGTLKSGQAIRIFTGAPVPNGADCIVMQEKVTLENDRLQILDIAIKQYANIRSKGSQIEKTELALAKGISLTAAAIGFIAGMGITDVHVVRKPKVKIIVTGSELQKPGNILTGGQIYESNSYSIIAALKSIGISTEGAQSVPDNEAETNTIIANSIDSCDILLLSGGISVGDYDFVERALKKLEVQTVFYKVKQKPGKPLYFGKYNNTYIFALPGNPAAVLTCFYEYVYPAIRLMMGSTLPYAIGGAQTQMPIASDYLKKKGLSFFLKGKISDNTVIPLDGQESYILSSFASADCLIYLPEESENIKAGQLVEVHKLPGLQ
ncbi:MAG: molybdopterin molybdotransferase MoeA [Bacteroidota bacterium]|nr:molybdopterin molybdotransferase MoeA [Bacteroidota bacterium]